MNNKRWSFLAIILIAIGIAGMAYQQFDFNNEDTSHHSQQWTLEKLHNLQLESDYDVEVAFVKSTDANNHITVSGNMKQDTIDLLKETVASGDSFTLKLTQKNTWSFFSIGFTSTKQQITVALTDPDQLHEVKFKLRSNNGTFKEIQGNVVDLSATSGNLKMDQVTASNQLNIRNHSGNISISQVQGNTDIKLTSGNIEIDKLEGNLNVKSTSGNIKANDVDGSVTTSLSSGTTKFINLRGNGVFNSTSGNITLEGQRSDSLDITNHSGNVILSVDEGFKGLYDLRTTSGTIKSPDSPMQTNDVIKIRVTSGNIRIK